MVKAVQQAKARLQPAQVGFGTGKAYLNVNRDAIGKKSRLWTQAANLEGPSDKTLAVVLFTDMQGKPIAGYMNYPMHAVNGFLTGITTADFPGAACRYVEKAFKDDMVMVYTQGASGDQNPLWLRPGTNALASKTGVDITGYEMVREDDRGPAERRKGPPREAGSRGGRHPGAIHRRTGSDTGRRSHPGDDQHRRPGQRRSHLGNPEDRSPFPAESAPARRGKGRPGPTRMAPRRTFDWECWG